MRVAILRAVGDGGLQDPGTGVYVSSQRDTIVPYSSWAESLVNHDRIRAVEVLEGSEWGEYVNHVAQNQGDQEAALAEYRKVLPSGNAKAEKLLVVKDAADLENQESEMRTDKTGKAAVAKHNAPEVKPAPDKA